MRIAILGMLLAGCATFDITRPVSNAPDLVSWIKAPHSCFTPCGMHATEGDCGALQRYESRVVSTLARVMPETEQQICEGLNGYELEVHWATAEDEKACPRGGWVLFKGFCAGGYTHVPPEPRIEVATPDWAKSALAHEIVHAIGGFGHCRWHDPRLIVALYELTGEVDQTRPEASCSR